MSNTITTAKVQDAVNITKNAEARALVEKFRQLKQAENAGARAKKERLIVEDQLRTLMGGAATLIIFGNSVVRESSVRTSEWIDADVLKDAYPEAYAVSLRSKTYTFLQTL